MAGSLARGAGDPLINMARRMLGNAAIIKPESNRILMVMHNDRWILPGGNQRELQGWEGLASKVKNDLLGIEMKYAEKKPIEVTALGINSQLVTAIVYSFDLVKAPERISPFSRIQAYEWTDMAGNGYDLSELMKEIFKRLRQRD